MTRWIGVDFDGTLAYDPAKRTSPYDIGLPIVPMVNRVKMWIVQGYDVRLLTARMCKYSHTAKCYRDTVRMENILKKWCKDHIGKELRCTSEKDGLMEVLWDDRAVRVLKDTGMPDLDEVPVPQKQADSSREMAAEFEEALSLARHFSPLLAKHRSEHEQ